MSGTRILIILLIVNIGLVALSPSTFIGENEVFTRVATAFGMEIMENQTADGTNTTMVLINSTTNTTQEALGLNTQTTGGAIVSAVTSFFSPLLFILEFIKLIYSFAFAPITLLGKLGFPWFLRLIIGLPLVVLYILAIASWLRGVKF